MITNTHQAALPHPEVSCLRKMSAKTLNRTRSHATQRKKTSIDQKTSMNG